MSVCESTHLLDQQTAVRLTMRHGLYNGKLNGKLNHICWDKEIVKTVHPQLLGNCKTCNMGKVSIVTIEAHVLGDNRLQKCQRHQTDIRTLEQPFLTARSTIWHRRNGSNKVSHRKWFSHAMYTHATNSIEHRWSEALRVDPIEEFALTQALHNDRRRLVMNLECFGVWKHVRVEKQQLHNVRRSMLS